MPNTIQDYINTQPKERREILQKARAAILEIAPEAKETTAWGMPTFVHPKKTKDKNIIHFASSKNHLGIYPGAEAVVAFTKRLDKSGLRHSKGAIQLPYAQPIPYDLIQDIVRWRLKHMEEN